MRSFALSRTSLERFLTHNNNNNNKDKDKEKENKEKNNKENNNTPSSPSLSSNSSSRNSKKNSLPNTLPVPSPTTKDGRKLSASSAPPVTTISTASAASPKIQPKQQQQQQQQPQTAPSKTTEQKQSIFAAFLARMPIASKRHSRSGPSNDDAATSASNSKKSERPTSSTSATAPPHLTMDMRNAAMKDAKAILRTVKTDWQFRPKSSSSSLSKKRKSAGGDSQLAVAVQGESRLSTETTVSTNDSLPPLSTPTPPSTAPTTAENSPHKSSHRASVATQPSTASTRPSEEYNHPIEVDLDDDNDDEPDEDFDEEGAEYRLREESDSDGPTPQRPLQAGENRKSGASVYTDDGTKSPYRFDGPDAIGKKLTPADRREKRKKEQTEECEWNEGLRNWVEQRDLWTKADKDGRIKVAKSKFEDNPLRRLVQPDQYPQIYSRVIIRSAEPPIPINLKDLTAALVQGWKADNQWPPKPQQPEPMFAKRRPNSGSSIGDSMLKKVLGLR